MAGVFVSYRRDDSSGYAGRLYERLVREFGRKRVFMDLDTLEPGVDFVERIDEAVASADVLLAVIGRTWLSAALGEGGSRRLDDPNDFVRLEIATALRRGIRVIPLLVGGARMPPGRDLPLDLDALARRHAHELSDSRWSYDVERLVEAIRPLVSGEAEPAAARAPEAQLPELGLPGYRIEQLVARGEMGTVYVATQLGIERPVLLRVLGRVDALPPAFRERVKHDTMVAAALGHPHILPIHDVGESAGVLYLVTQRDDGVSLAELIEDGPLDPGRVGRIVAQTASALDAAHARGLVHRDVRPFDIRVVGAGAADHVYLTGFGLTRHGTREGVGLSKAGGFVGTVQYTPPELIEGRDADARSDVYALGATAFHALTGRVPFEGDTLRTLLAHLQQQPPEPSRVAPELPTGIDAVITRALAKTPAERYPSAGEFAAALQAAIGAGG